jgi:hypothetical protein
MPGVRYASGDISPMDGAKRMRLLHNCMNVRSRVLVVTSLITLFLLVGGQLAPRSAEAALSSCRSDPVILLSNGGAIDVGAGISDNLSDVRSVRYIIHGPAGVFPLVYLNTDGLMGLKESFKYVADNSWNTYDLYTTVYTGHAGVRVSANVTLLSVLGVAIGLQTANGMSNQSVHLHVKGLL